MVRLFWVGLLLLFVNGLNAQTNHYELYVMSGCANCALTKHTIKPDASKYTFHNVDSALIGKQMVKRLRELGYSGRIHMPVIIANDSILMHPVVIQDNHFKPVKLNDVLTAIQNNRTSILPLKEDLSSSVDCDFKEESTVHYLVCANFKTVDEAIHMVEVLKKRGYEQADFIFHQKFFRVYSHVSDDISVVQELIADVRKQYRASYILSEEMK